MNFTGILNHYSIANIGNILFFGYRSDFLDSLETSFFANEV